MQVDSREAFGFYGPMRSTLAGPILNFLDPALRYSRLRCTRLCVFMVATVSVSLGAARAAEPELAAALKTFRTDGPKGWSFVQTTEAAGQSRVERFDGAQPEFNRWTLLKQDGQAATPEEVQDYQEKASRRSRGGTAPRLTDQLDLGTAKTVGRDSERTTYRCSLKPAESGDATARFLKATLVLHRPTSTIETFTLASIEPFSPSLGVKIQEMVTTMTYSLPTATEPSLLLSSRTRVRGTAFWFKSLDADRVVTYTEYMRARPVIHAP